MARRRVQISKERRDKIFKRDGYRCCVCGTDQDLTIDHVIPLSAGGSNLDSNLVTMCQEHNEKKGCTRKYHKKIRLHFSKLKDYIWREIGHRKPKVKKRRRRKFKL